MKPPIVFLAFANDRQNDAQYLRGLSAELSGIRLALQSARRAGRVEVVERANASLADIIDVFNEPEYQGRIKIFHYGGHANSYQLLLESSAGAPEYADAKGFARFLARQKSLELVFLNACSTQQQTDYLLSEGVPAAIATSAKISDNIATHLAIRFYKSLAAYLPVAQAFQDATDEVRTLYGEKNVRGMYIEEEGMTDPAPTQFPWDMYPDGGTAWRIEPPVSQSGVAGVKLGPYSYTMVDRNEQKDEFDNQFFVKIAQAVRKPQVFLIHGTKEDRHESLVNRFSFESIGKNTYIRPYEVKNWPTAGDGPNLLKMRILSQLEAINLGTKTAATLAASDLIHHPFFSTQKNVIFRHDIPGEEWNSMTFELLEWYITQFWNVEIKDSTVPNFSIFINVLYAPEQLKSSFLGGLFSKTITRDKIIDKLEKIAEAHDHITFLPELKPVKRDHLDTWLLDSKLNDYSEFSSLTDTIFAAQSAANGLVTMAALENVLKKTIESFLVKNSGVYG